MFTLEDHKAKKLENGIRAALHTPETINEDALFGFAEYDPGAAEKTGYSNYSYWRSTLQAFCKNRVALCLSAVLALLLIFTLIQPLLPGQYAPNTINNYPMTNVQIKNVAPSLGGVLGEIPAGTRLVYAKAPGYEGWYAVKNAADSIPRRTAFTVTQYGQDWCAVEVKGVAGYVKNNFLTKLKLPENPENTPYESKSNFEVQLYTSPDDYTNPDVNSGGWVYVKATDVRLLDESALETARDTQMRLLPTSAGFLFGTNIIGQDLWARVWSGTRTSLYIGFMVAVVEAFVGILVGILWGYVRRLDRIFTEIYNVLDNIPTTIVLILIAYVMSPSVSTLIFAMCLTRWMGMARFIRNQIIIIRDRDYNIASRCLGTGTGQIMLKNLLPYLVSVIMLRMALAIPGAISNEVFITYIGLGVPIDTPSLGNLINEGRKLFATATLRYQLLFPTIVLSVITISFYIIGNAFADAADPKNHL